MYGDTDNIVITQNELKFDDMVKDELKTEYLQDKKNWFPSDSEEVWKTVERDGKPYTLTVAQFEHRKYGLWKIEKIGWGMCAVLPKFYCLAGFDENKIGCRGLNKRKYNQQYKDQREQFYHMKKLMYGEINTATNRGFVQKENEVVTMVTDKTCRAFFLDKRICGPDLINTRITTL